MTAKHNLYLKNNLIILYYFVIFLMFRYMGPFTKLYPGKPQNIQNNNEY